MTTKYIKAAGGNSNAAATLSAISSAGVDNAGPATAADDIVGDIGSGNFTINAAMACRSFDCNNLSTYGGTITHNSSVTVTVGDATAGANNIALRLAGTYNIGAVSSAWTFVSTSATQQSIYTGGKTVGNWLFNATSNGSWILQDNVTANTANTTTTLTKGSLDTNGNTLTLASFASNNSNVRSLTLGASTITCSGTLGWTLTTTTNLTFNAGTSSITLSANSSVFDGGGLTYNNVSQTGAAVCAIVGANTFATYTRTATASKTCTIELRANQICTTAFVANSNSDINRLLIHSNTKATSRTITAATVTAAFVVDFQDITGAGAGTWTVAASGATAFGDCGGNSGITFTSGTTLTATNTASFAWSTHAWSGRSFPPLAQDTVSIPNNFVAGRTITMDMPRAGGSITCSCTGSPIFSVSVSSSFFGSLNLTGCGSISGSVNVTFEGRSNYILTTAGLAWMSTGGIFVTAPGGKLTLGDNLTATGNTLTLTNGEFDAATFNLSLGGLSSSVTTTRILSLGSGTWTFAGLSGWTTTTTTGLTVNAGTSTILISNTTASQKLWQWGGITVNNITVTGNNVAFSQAVTCNALAVNTAGLATGLLLASNTTTVFQSLTTNGSAGNLATMGASTAGQQALFSCANLVSVDYMAITDNNAENRVPFYAGVNSTLSNTTDWNNTAPPTSSRRGFVRGLSRGFRTACVLLGF